VNSKTSVAVIGAGGHAKVVISTLRAGGLDVVGVYDDDPAKRGQQIAKVPVIGLVAEIHSGTAGAFVIAIGSNALRRQVAERLSFVRWLTVVHPNAYVHGSVKVGPGTVVFAGAVIQPDTIIGRHCIINTGATVDHDCSLGNFTHVAPGCHLAGEVSLAEGVFMGIGSVAIPGIKIGEWTTVGAGGVVVTDLPPRQTAVGVPARVVNSRTDCGTTGPFETLKS
jgi:sugar O-acyltransferase (sialic acid O-acetyltransferase NeuD family)